MKVTFKVPQQKTGKRLFLHVFIYMTFIALLVHSVDPIARPQLNAKGALLATIRVIVTNNASEMTPKAANVMKVALDYLAGQNKAMRAEVDKELQCMANTIRTNIQS